jgi:hypothetical protein
VSLRFVLAALLLIATASTGVGQATSASEVPEWCKALPRPDYKALERVTVSDAWFEVYKPAKNVFAIYEPHQAEETIGYLIVGDKRALLFDTGMGISDVKKVTAELTKLPIVVVNSHTHDDHVGGNWEFETGVWDGYGVHADECEGFAGGCTGGDCGGSNLR